MGLRYFDSISCLLQRRSQRNPFARSIALRATQKPQQRCNDSCALPRLVVQPLDRHIKIRATCSHPNAIVRAQRRRRAANTVWTGLASNQPGEGTGQQTSPTRGIVHLRPPVRYRQTSRDRSLTRIVPRKLFNEGQSRGIEVLADGIRGSIGAASMLRRFRSEETTIGWRGNAKVLPSDRILFRALRNLHLGHVIPSLTEYRASMCKLSKTVHYPFHLSAY